MKKFWDAEMAPHWMKIDGKIGCAFSSAGGWGACCPNDEFDRQVMDGLRQHFPELTDDARRVIAGNYSYSHAK